MNRDVIKYVAMVTMFCNHFAQVMLKPGTILFEVMVDIGYFTAVTMCYFLVEGFHYTRSRKKYAGRLFLFGVISQVPYTLALGIYQLNMMFTLFFCFLILWAKEEIENPAERKVAVILLFVCSVFADWSMLAAMFTLLFAWSRGSKRRTALVYGINALVFALLNYASYLSVQSPGGAFLPALGSCVGILVSGVVILFLYNGKKSPHSGRFTKWFFYVFYPGHLLLLYLMHIGCGFL